MGSFKVGIHEALVNRFLGVRAENVFRKYSANCVTENDGKQVDFV